MVEYSQKWHNEKSRTRNTETSDRLVAIQAQLNNLGREIKKVNEKVYATQVRCEQCKGPHYIKDCPLKEEASTDAAVQNQEASIKTLEIQIGQISKELQERGFGSIPSSIKANPRDHVKSISTTDETDSNLIRRIRSPQYAVSTPKNRRFMFKSRQATIPFPSPSHIDKSIPQKEKDLRSFTLPCYINNVCFDNAFADLGVSISVMSLLTYLNLGLGELAHTKLTVELADRTVKYPKGIAENMLVGIGKFVFPVDFIILDMPEDVKLSLILGRPFLSTTHTMIDVFKRKITLRVRDEKIIFKSVKPASSLIKRVYKSLDPLYGDYIELNDLNVPLELRRDQVDDLMPTIEEGEVIKEFRARNDARMVMTMIRKSV
ncbi:mitochondrial proton/calcium exchanger protein-like protein isoform X1 [Tanacetum coccineum]